MKKTTTFTFRQLLPGLAFLFFGALIICQSCQKEKQPSQNPGSSESTSRKKPQNPPPPPPPFYFNNCSYPIYAATFTAGVAGTATITKNYINSPGGSYAAFTSTTVNGITITAPAGTFNAGSGSVVFTATGTPGATGIFTITISVGNIIPCSINFTVLNPPATGPTVDPGPTAGSTGVVNFIYKGQAVAYRTVRAKDGKIWLQQNLGSPQVAIHEMDQASYGDYFQWGRWDDGHQRPNSSTITGGSSLLNPSHISSGNPNFIKGTTASTQWWATGGLASDTWSGTTITSTNGKDPCAALGTGWRLPTEAEWQNISIQEDLFGTIAAFQSNLKLPSAGYRLSYDGSVYQNGDIGYYWTRTAANNSNARVLFFDNVYNAGVTNSERGHGFNCRCIKD
ncbi:MAG TPA: hypothetical protein VFI06_17030 [Chitinophagaceae bacterium]|nr:hypothetical protein [Chitinophagaceae bacterium]